MLKDFTIANLLDLNETIAKDLFEGKTYPWEVLPEIGDFILKLGQTLSEEEYDHPSEDVWIAKSAKVAPTACINGPVIIGKEAEVRHCAFIRDGPVRTIAREARKKDTIINFVQKERLDQLSETGAHQGVIAQVAAYEYASVEDILAKAKEKGEDPFIFILDNIEDPHNLGAIIRTANLAGAHGVIIPKRRAVGLTSTVAKTSAGALNYTPVAKVTNLGHTIDELKEQGMWFVCADMGGETMYNLNLTGPIGVVIGNEGEGVSRLIREKCDFVASIPMKGDIDSLNASVAAGVLGYEIVRQRLQKK